MQKDTFQIVDILHVVHLLGEITVSKDRKKIEGL